MEWYTLDDQLRRDQIIENFQSFIWTERYSASGDFQIVIQSTFQTRQLLAVGTWITKDNSTYVMIVDTIDDVTAEDGTRNITVTGSSLEALLNDRVAMPALASLTVTPNWVITAAPGDIARTMFNDICVTCVLSQEDTIPFYHLGTLLPAGNLVEPPEFITISAAPDTLYNTVKSICDTYSLGFRLVRNGELGEIYFEIYTGNDLTTDQSVLPPVVFDPDMENLEEINLLASSAAEKTVAYVFAQNGTTVVYAPDASPTDSGTDRRVLLVNSTNDDVAGAPLIAALQQEGLQALTAQRAVYQFDGTLPQSSAYVYGVDYNLGDLIEERYSDGFSNQMLVTEQIFSSDDTGEHSYPTLTLAQTITPGTWLAWNPLEPTWSDVNPSEVWATS